VWSMIYSWISRKISFSTTDGMEKETKKKKLARIAGLAENVLW